MPMTSTQRKQLKAKLTTLRDEVLSRGAHLVEPTTHDDVERPNAEDDQPLSEMLQSIASSRNRHDMLVLDRVRNALAKLNETPDEYGECEDCGDSIPLDRMKAMPWATLCVECQGKLDGRSKATRQKVADYR
jgi:DnaK suppressor protein